MIYVNGDSWTSGWPDEETYGHREYSWPHLLSIKLDEPVINDARAASSNYRIYRRTFDYLLKNNPRIAIVCLTSWLRIEMGHAESGKIYQYLPSKDKKYFKSDWHPYLAYSNFLRQIISLQAIAKTRGNTLFFLDTFNDNLNWHPTLDWFKAQLQLGYVFDKMDDTRIEQKFNKILDLNGCINYNMFLSTDSYQSIIKNCKLEHGHPVKDGHEFITNFIYQKIKDISWQNHST
jgi:hypothetical protein